MAEPTPPPPPPPPSDSDPAGSGESRSGLRASSTFVTEVQTPAEFVGRGPSWEQFVERSRSELSEIIEQWDLGEGAEGQIRQRIGPLLSIGVSVPMAALHAGDGAWVQSRPTPEALAAFRSGAVFLGYGWDIDQTDPTQSRWGVWLTVWFPAETTQAAIVAAAKAAAKEMAGWFREASPAPPVTRRLW